MTKARDAEGPVLPAVSVARTSNNRPPAGCSTAVYGELQAANPPGSSVVPTRHSNDAPASLDENMKVGVASLVRPDGPPLIDTEGKTVSMVNARVAGGPVLNAASVALTSKVLRPSASAPVV